SALWSAIEQACEREDFRAHPSRLCDFCSFKPYCPAHGGNPQQAVELRGALTDAPGATATEPALHTA
ncbi:MAG TPA: recombinase RecB, partial [Acidimicrobiia bacterium]|nr:recombinase RecB [Acidimicrobiia bacterium]